MKRDLGLLNKIAKDEWEALAQEVYRVVQSLEHAGVDFMAIQETEFLGIIQV